jgi:pimeloyl-ACP methyl ester carboxylesterase
MPYAEVNDIRMYYEEQGQGEPLVLMHGATGAIDFHLSGWGGLMPAFAERYRAIHLEHRGHGRTNNPAGKLSYEQIADDVAKFVEQLGLAPAHVAGVSDGGIVALALGMTRPELVRTLVCVGANYLNDAQVKEANKLVDAEVLEREHPDFAAALADFAAALAGFHDPHHHPGYWRELVGQLQANLAVAPAYTEADLRRIPTPTLLIAGETDLWGNLDQMLAMRRNIPHSEMLILNHAGLDELANHCVQETRADVVGPVVLDFLGRHAGAAASEAGA